MIEEELKRKANPDNYDSFGAWAKANKWLVILSPIYLIFGLVAARSKTLLTTLRLVVRLVLIALRTIQLKLSLMMQLGLTLI